MGRNFEGSRKCEGCGCGADVQVRTTNGGLFLCDQCLGDINRKNPEVRRQKNRADLLRNALIEMMKWQSSVQELLPDGLANRIEALLAIEITSNQNETI